LTRLERREYIDALFCLRSLPSVLSNDQYPGVQDRFDDFVAYVRSSTPIHSLIENAAHTSTTPRTSTTTASSSPGTATTCTSSRPSSAPNAATTAPSPTSTGPYTPISPPPLCSTTPPPPSPATASTTQTRPSSATRRQAASAEAPAAAASQQDLLHIPPGQQTWAR
jgi:tyrosinase